MSNRRSFLRAGTAVLLATGARSAAAQSAPAKPSIGGLQPHGYQMTNGGTALKRKDGAWVFWARIVNFDDRHSDITASIQIATDRGFSQIVDVLPIKLTERKSFIDITPYKPKVANTQLYYRYVIGASPETAPSITSVVHVLAPWDNESKAG